MIQYGIRWGLAFDQLLPTLWEMALALDRAPGFAASSNGQSKYPVNFHASDRLDNHAPSEREKNNGC